MNVMTKAKHPVMMWTEGVPVEPAALSQLENIANMPFIHHHVAVMPDVHLGRGATVGSVIPTVGAIIPAAVGVDIGCGMMAVRLPMTGGDLPGNLSDVRSKIEAAVPVGNGPGGSHTKSNGDATRAANELYPRLVGLNLPAGMAGRYGQQIGTLGGGNHFIELCLDETDRVWVMLHSGSRGIGNKIGQHYIALAREDMRKHFINLPDKDLSYLTEGTEHFDEYVMAVEWAQDYAAANRRVMMNRVLGALGTMLPEKTFVEIEAVQCHHNYISRENHYGKNAWVTRKGAVHARAGELGIIPGSMGQKSYIVSGKGNQQSLTSCSHGAGRAMSRTEAKRRFTVDDHIAATEGVECRKDVDVIDETPAAYKNLDAVMLAQADLVDVVHTLKAVLCVKG